MDGTRAARMGKELTGTTIAGWRLVEVVGNGATALVFRGVGPGDQIAAVKLFDPELVERSGEVVELERIERQLETRAHPHPNLVATFAGGRCVGSRFLYLAMEFVEAPTLTSVVGSLPRDRIRPLIAQLASVAEHLDSLGIAHRDIKPDNIAVRADFSILTLLDLGVCRPHAGSDITDRDGLRFVGTPRYSSPEYLRRDHDDRPETWRALTFYQLGAVLHDMVTRRRLFEGLDQTRLSEAVLHEIPSVIADDVSPELVQLARRCLVKDPTARLSLVRWSDFYAPPPAVSVASQAKERLLARAGAGPRADYAANASFRLRVIVDETQKALRWACVAGKVLPPIETPPPLFTPNGATIDVQFAPSAALGHRCLCLRLALEFIEPHEEAIIVTAVAWAARSPGQPPAPARATEVFRSLYDATSLAHALDGLPFLAMDEAEQRCMASNDDTFSVPLNLEGEEPHG